MKILAIDYGLTRTGLAISDMTGFLASPLPFIYSYNEDKLLEGISDICRKNAVETIIIGLPMRTDGGRSEMADKVLLFKNKLEERTGLSVFPMNEMYTTVIASRQLHENNKKAKDQKNLIDSAAATVLLQDYLDGKNK